MTKEVIVEQLNEVLANTESEEVAAVITDAIKFINKVSKPQIWTSDSEL